MSIPSDHTLSIFPPIPITGIVVVIPGNIDYNEYVHRGSLLMQGLKAFISEDKLTLLSTNPKNLEQLSQLSSTYSHLIYFSNEKYVIDTLCPSALWEGMNKFQHRSYYAFQLDQYHLFPLKSNESSLSTEEYCGKYKDYLPFESKLTLAYQNFNAILSRKLSDVDYTQFLLPQTNIIHVPYPIYNMVPQFDKRSDVINVFLDIPQGIPENRSTSASLACEIFSEAFNLYELARKEHTDLLPLHVMLTDRMPSHIPAFPNQQFMSYMTRQEFLDQLQSTHLYGTAFLHYRESNVLGN